MLLAPTCRGSQEPFANFQFIIRNYFLEFQIELLKDYPKFKKVVDDFRNYYGLTEFNYKELDQYLWQLGKKYFRQYGLDE